MPAPATLDSKKLQAAWVSPDSFATTLLVLFIDTYGTDGCAWSPETIKLEIEDDFRVTLPQPNFDRLMTAINLLTADDFYQSLPDFINYCNLLSGDSFDPRVWDPADATEIAWGITEGLMLSPPEPNDEEPFSEEIVAYIGKVLDQEGIIQPPDVLKIAIRDQDPSAFIDSEFSDDPELFDSIYDFETSKTSEINRLIRANLQLLASQLESLPLRNGSAVGVVQQMLRALPAEEPETII